MVQAYRLLLLALESQKLLSIQPPSRVYSTNGLLQDSIGTGNPFKAVTQKLFQNRVSRVLQWLKVLFASREY